MAKQKTLLLPSGNAYPCRDAIERYVSVKSGILPKTRIGCGMRISEGAVSLLVPECSKRVAEQLLGKG
jgi:hypothetical protein